MQGSVFLPNPNFLVSFQPVITEQVMKTWLVSCTERWLELCFLGWLQWLQWSHHSQLLDVVWCSAVIVVADVVVVVVGLMLLKL